MMVASLQHQGREVCPHHPGVKGEEGVGEVCSQPDQPALTAPNGQGARSKEFNGTYHCPYFKRAGKCDVCSHIVEKRDVLSRHFKRKHSIAGRNNPNILPGTGL